MSLITDGFALGAAAAVAVGSAIQARQAYVELNAETPAINSLIRLLWATIEALFLVVLPKTNVARILGHLVNLELLTAAPAELTRAQAAALTPAQAAALAPGRAAALTAEQTAALTAGQAVALTLEQRTALNAAGVKDLKKWLGWLLGWSFILLGAFAALVGTALMLVNDL